MPVWIMQPSSWHVNAEQTSLVHSTLNPVVSQVAPALKVHRLWGGGGLNEGRDRSGGPAPTMPAHLLGPAALSSSPAQEWNAK